MVGFELTDKVQWQAFVNTIMNFCVEYTQTILTSYIYISEWACAHRCVVGKLFLNQVFKTSVRLLLAS
jgi:hypothetical protein